MRAVKLVQAKILLQPEQAQTIIKQLRELRRPNTEAGTLSIAPVSITDL
jgi:hypothetical protein